MLLPGYSTFSSMGIYWLALCGLVTIVLDVGGNGPLISTFLSVFDDLSSHAEVPKRHTYSTQSDPSRHFLQHALTVPTLIILIVAP